MPDFLFTGPHDAKTAILLAHGAGAPMDSAWMNAFADRLAAKDIRVARFEFSYMAARRTGEGRKPPPRAETLLGEYRAAADAIGAGTKLFIGGKSMGGRVASMVADALYAEKKIAGLVCLGYPFHPPGSPEKLRTAHLEKLVAPTLICQGERDPFGTRDEVAGYKLSPAITLHWLEDGDHDLKPRKDSRATGKGNLDAAAERIVGWVAAG
ncbi:alpha/beta family hydrolase [Mesorhizobium sp. WSM2239]|uniref:Alpha/beta family hydrolase n=2 Tax=unclassified Mesorhizobium TaxID=325217 RepID=A0AAU8DD46_9HYPH